MPLADIATWYFYHSRVQGRAIAPGGRRRVIAEERNVSMAAMVEAEQARWRHSCIDAWKELNLLHTA